MSARRFASSFKPLQRVGAVRLAAVLRWEEHERQHVVFVFVHQGRELGTPPAQLARHSRDTTPALARSSCKKRVPQGGSDQCCGWAFGTCARACA